MFLLTNYWIIYIVVCFLLTIKCRKWKSIPWTGYILTVIPFVSFFLYNHGYVKAFIIASVICGIVGLALAILLLLIYKNNILLILSELILDAVLVLLMNIKTVRDSILIGFSLGSVFMLAYFSYAWCDFKWGLKHMNG